MKKNKFIIEIAVIFIIYNCLNFIFFPDDPGFVRFKLHPYWIAVLLISARYGLYPGITVGFVACFQFLVFSLGGMPTRAIIEQMAENGSFVVPLAFVLVGAFLGNIRQKYINMDKEKSAALSNKIESLDGLNQRYEALEKAKKVLEARIVGETTTVKTLYKAAEKLDAMDAKSIYQGGLDILAGHFQVKKASVHIREGGYYVLKSYMGWTEKEAVEGKVSEEQSLMDLVFEKNGVVTVQDILKEKASHRYISQYGQVLAMFPLRDEKNHPIGVLNIEEMDFLSFTRPNLELIELVVNWVSRALCNKKLYDVATSESINDKELGVYSFHYFGSVLENEFIRATDYKLPLAVSLVKLDRYGFFGEEKQKLLNEAVIALLRRYLPVTDMVFKYKYDGMFALISPMSSEKLVMKKIADVEKGISGIVPEAQKERPVVQLSLGCAEAGPGIKDAPGLLRLAAEKLKIDKS
ncbi:MAG: GAF domain-containing protein [Candidatus Omnitrophica bacterium]|nr:GAF domain-containing protein [Candidatus Omnitrophota bacterium]